ncbi:MAG TPA: hypothetical protein VFU90_06520 [Candidatus Tumulicola sp.]|nr:hypothetical protein [Candidatus Tumulicola sp.]
MVSRGCGGLVAHVAAEVRVAVHGGATGGAGTTGGAAPKSTTPAMAVEPARADNHLLFIDKHPPGVIVVIAIRRYTASY